MWLRDSTNQVLPYVPYGPVDEVLQRMLEGLIARQARSVLIDSFANAFNFNASGQGHQQDQRTPPMQASVFEGKYEVDSLCAFLKLSYWHWRMSGDAALERLASNDWVSAVGRVLDTLQVMQRDDGRSDSPPYLFQRQTSEALDTLSVQGRGPPCRPQGMTRSLFRPSDDAVTLPYNVPGNAMACVELTHLQDLLDRLALLTGGGDSSQARLMLQQAQEVAEGICGALDKLMQQQQQGGEASPLPFELDGFGAQYYMDDANIPSLLSLPVLGYLSPNSAQYTATRAFALSPANPYFYTGSEGRGVGGPHEGVNFTWPMAVIAQAMTSADDAEVAWCLQMLVRSSAGTGLMHESFDVDDVSNYTRDWFAWANGLLGELLLQLVLTKPHLVLLDSPEAVGAAQAVVRAPVSLMAQREALVQ
mmetsp:Transcript_32083/g.70683  ORF Transcript_32083/g.70683 Transcript_32083/m.70683 type:complete len:419 (+) Transcript_32083:403-1659(+)